MKRRSLAAALAAGALAGGLLAGCPRSGPPRAQVAPPPGVARDSAEFTTGEFDGCPPEGSGGDSRLNRLKNRDLPPAAYEPMTIDQLVSNRPFALLDAGRRNRALWSDDALDRAAAWENLGIALEGYLLLARQQGPESCNCKSLERRDFHLWLAPAAAAGRYNAIVCEVSPRLLPAHPNWRLRLLSRLARDRAYLRVSGWLLWDQEHPDQVGATRASQWEVHPIHRIEVWSGGGWRDLDG